jgi:hypothetical protein
MNTKNAAGRTNKEQCGGIPRSQTFNWCARECVCVVMHCPFAVIKTRFGAVDSSHAATKTRFGAVDIVVFSSLTRILGLRCCRSTL